MVLSHTPVKIPSILLIADQFDDAVNRSAMLRRLSIPLTSASRSGKYALGSRVVPLYAPVS